MIVSATVVEPIRQITGGPSRSGPLTDTDTETDSETERPGGMCATVSESMLMAAALGAGGAEPERGGGGAPARALT